MAIGEIMNLFGKKYHYYLVKFDTDKSYWYRSNDSGYRTGMKVIVPISNNGLWEIGVIVEAKSFKANDVPYPLDKTKGVVEKAGLRAQHKVDVHNAEIDNSKYPPLDISVAGVRTRKGIVDYITCEEERNQMRKKYADRKPKIVMIETYPMAKPDEIPKEAQKRLREEKLELLNYYMELMEELDQYN